MSQLTPILGSAVQTSGAQQQQAAEKLRGMRKAQQLKKNAAAIDDEDHEEVENPDAVVEIHDEQHPSDQRQSPKRHREFPPQSTDSDSDHIDLTA